VGRDFPPVQTSAGAHPASCKMGTGSFPGVKYGRGVLLTTHPLLVPRSWKSRDTSIHPLSHTKACNGDTLLLRFYFLSTPLSQSLSLCSPHNKRDHVSYSYRRRKVFVLCVSNFTFAYRQRDDKRFWTKR